MYCGNCGTEIDENVEFCPKCGKTKKDEIEVNKQNIRYGFPLSNLTANLFSILFEVILWIILIGGFIGGAILFYNIDKNMAAVGLILGGIISFIFIILIGGLVSLFIKIVNNTEEIKSKLK
jgi:hypothetical protein